MDAVEFYVSCKVYSIVYSGADQKNIKAPRHWPLCREFTGDRGIHHTNGQ